MSFYPRMYYINKLNESPDNIRLTSGELQHNISGTYPFGYRDNILCVGAEGGVHGLMRCDGKRYDRKDYQFPGRIWTKEKIISFWIYPDKEQLKTICSQLSEKLNIKILDDPKWRIEILKNSEGDTIKKYDETSEEDEQPSKFKNELIPISTYIGSEQHSEEDLKKQHTTPPLLKKKKVPQGWGSTHPKYQERRAWQMASSTSESKQEILFYPNLNEGKDITSGKFIIDMLIKEFPEKYSPHSNIYTRIKNKSKISINEFVTDIKFIIKKYDLEVDLNSIKILNPKEGYEYKIDVSSAYKSVMFKIGEKYKNIVLAGTAEGEQLSKTPTIFKEGMVIFFFTAEKDYYPTGKNKKTEYTKLIELLIKDIKTKGIKGLDKLDVDNIINTLINEDKQFNDKFLTSILNAMSIGNKLKQTKFKSWEPHRDKEFFSKLKNDIAEDLKFKRDEVDKWNPMDLILVKPISNIKQEILGRCILAQEKDTEQLKLGEYNSLFVDDLNNPSNDALILAISLKEQNAQGGRGKSYLRRIEDVKDKYNLTKDEQTWSSERFMSEIVNERKLAIKNIDKLKNSELYSYEMDEPIDGFKNTMAAKPKYASLKLLNYVLRKIPEDNLFIDLAAYSLSLGKNPAFFKIEGSKTGDADKVKITKFEQTGGISIYNRATQNYDGKIHIRDSNTNAGIEITYYIVVGKELYNVSMYIRTTDSITSKKNLQVNIEIHKINKIKDLTENFYPQLNEKFVEDSDPIHDMNIGGYSFETLRMGAVLKSKRQGIAVTINKSGHFTNWRYGFKLRPEKFILILQVNKYESDNYKEIRFILCYNEMDLQERRERLKKYNIMPSGFGINRMIVSKKMFDYRFDIIEKGF